MWDITRLTSCESCGESDFVVCFLSQWVKGREMLIPVIFFFFLGLETGGARKFVECANWNTPLGATITLVILLQAQATSITAAANSVRTKAEKYK